MMLRSVQSYPTGTSTCVTKTSWCNLRETFSSSAISKNSVSASTRFARASSTDHPWLAMSNSGHSATNPSSSRSMIAVSRGDPYIPQYMALPCRLNGCLTPAPSAPPAPSPTAPDDSGHARPSSPELFPSSSTRALDGSPAFAASRRESRR